MKIEVYDPPMCCSTGVCGPAIDPVLPRFAADLEWLKGQGVQVYRYNLAQQPRAFAENEAVKDALAEGENQCLPLILVDGRIVSRGVYPTREELAVYTGIAPPKESVGLYSPAVAELVAIGAAIASNCEPCFKDHFDRARKLGVSKEDMARAVATAQSVKEAPAQAVLKLAGRFLQGANPQDAPAQSCCGPMISADFTPKCCG
jgi:AhpD family alkylhydroperoxidase